MKRTKATGASSPARSPPIFPACCGSQLSYRPSVSPSALLRCWGGPRPETVDPDRHQPVAPHAVRAERNVQDRRAAGLAPRREDEVAERPGEQRVRRRRRNSAQHVWVRTEHDLRPRVQASRRELLLACGRLRMQLGAYKEATDGDD